MTGRPGDTTRRTIRDLAVERHDDGEILRRAQDRSLSTFTRPCESCGTEFRVRPNEVYKALRKGHRPRRFCSIPCRALAYRGNGNPNWRGGRRISNGYYLIYRPDHPNAVGGYVFEHRLVVESKIGRYLRAEEVVHHRNQIKTDNDPSNLELLPSQSAHRTRHAEWLLLPCGHCGTAVRRSLNRLLRDERDGRKDVCCSVQCAAALGSAKAAESAALLRRSVASGELLAGQVRAVVLTEHICSLRAAGMTWRDIRTSAAIGQRVIGDLLAGRRKTIGKSVADRLLGVVATGSMPVLVDAADTVTQVRRLFSNGHPRNEIARAAGLDRTTVSLLLASRRSRIRKSTADAIGRAVITLTPSAAPERGAGLRSVRRALREGWATLPPADPLTAAVDQPPNT